MKSLEKGGKMLKVVETRSRSLSKLILKEKSMLQNDKEKLQKKCLKMR